MPTAIDQFRINIARVRNLGSIVDALNSQTTQVLDLSDVLRAELVLAVSALDQFIHETVRLGMVNAYRGRRTRTQRFLRFEAPLEIILQGADEDAVEQWLDDFIRTRHGYRSFQTPERISEAIRLISDVRLWDEVSSRMNMSSQDIRETLSLIAKRRNQIAHEADINPSPYYELWPIDSNTVSSNVDFIERLCEAVHDVVNDSPQG